jgi:Holliday junction resolvase RusA-like endonuclease
MTYGAVPHAPLRGAVDRCAGSEKAAADLHRLIKPSGADRSSGVFVLNLPRPPSVNRFVTRLGSKSPIVLDWVRQCDRYVMAVRPRPRFHGPFEAHVTWNDLYRGKIDIDNCIKPLLDYLQRVEIIDNDRWCRRLVVDWGPVELGCRVAVRPWVSP